MKIRGRGLVEGTAKGEILVTSEPISFYGGVDPRSGRIVDKKHALYGKSIAGKILVFPYGKGSTVGSYVILSLAKNGVAPAAIVNILSEPIIIIGCVLAGIPLMDRPEKNPIQTLQTGEKGVLVVENGKAYLEVNEYV